MFVSISGFCASYNTAICFWLVNQVVASVVEDS